MTKKLQEGGEYRRGDDNEKADGDKAEVDDQPDVEEGEVAEGGHQLPVGVDQRGPEAELGAFTIRKNEEEPHMVRSMNMQMEALTTRTSWGT